MTLILAAVALLAALVAVIVATGGVRRPRRVAKRYALHMKGEAPSIEGLLIRRTRTSYLLIHADLLKDADSTYSLAGTVEVPRENVFVLQEIA